MRVVRRVGTVLYAGLLACACERGPVAELPTNVVVRDSLGVEIVTNAGPDRRLAISRDVLVGVVEGAPDLQFNNIRTIAVDSAGGFWVVDRHESVRHYSDTGEYMGSVGGEGQGPGEADGYSSAVVGAGAVLAVGWPAVLQLFDANDGLLESAPAMTADGPKDPLGHAAGQWVFTVVSYGGANGGVFRLPTDVVVAPSLDAAPASITRFNGDLTTPGFARASWFHGNPSIALDGRGTVFVSDTLVYRVNAYALDGSLRRVLERHTERRAWDPEWTAGIEAAVEAAFTSGIPNALPAGSGDPVLVAQVVEGAMPVYEPPHLPVVGRILASRDGTLWVERADLHPTPTMAAVARAFGHVRWAWHSDWVVPQVFDIFGPSGDYKGTVEVPGSIVPMAVTSAHVYAAEYDELGVERVARYRVEFEN